MAVRGLFLPSKVLDLQSKRFDPLEPCRTSVCMNNVNPEIFFAR